MKILQLKNIFPHCRVARYNLAVWQNNETQSLYFIGREVLNAGQEGEPDTGMLKLFESLLTESFFKKKQSGTPFMMELHLKIREYS